MISLGPLVIRATASAGRISLGFHTGHEVFEGEQGTAVIPAQHIVVDGGNVDKLRDFLVSLPKMEDVPF